MDIKITQPIEGLPLWTFSGLILPEFPESSNSSSAATYAENVPELQDEKYQKRQILNQNANDEYTNEVVTQIEKALEKIKDFPRSEATERILLEDWFGIQWNFHAKNMHCEIITDYKGYYMGWHLDNRKVMANIICNLQDNQDSTEFLIIRQPTATALFEYSPTQEEWKGPTEKGSGYFWFNNPAFWHQITINEEARRIAKLALMLF